MLIPLDIIMLAGVIYLALSKKSGFRIRVAALAALGLMVLSLIICLFLIMVRPAEPAPFIPFDLPVEATPDTGSNMFALLGVILFLVALFLAVLMLAMRENRRSGDKPA